MRKKISRALPIVLALSVVAPALALAGTYKTPPEGTEYAKDGSLSTVMTNSDGDSNDVAEKTLFSLGFYECGNNVPFQFKNVKIDEGVFKVNGEQKNLAGQKFDLSVKGKFKSAKKIVMKATISKGKCSEKASFSVKRQ